MLACSQNRVNLALRNHIKVDLAMNTIQQSYCVILAGGIGSRLWPVSRKDKPKQFLDFFGCGRTLLQQTYDRFLKILPPEHIFISTNAEYAGWISEQLPEVASAQILQEPIRRNTLPSVAWATAVIARQCPTASIIATPADQLIQNEGSFCEDVKAGLSFVHEHDAMLALAIKPTRPDTGYGYIQAGEPAQNESVYKVKSFTEKPSLEFARMFMESGEFYWNTGLFLWNVRSMKTALNGLVPDLVQGVHTPLGQVSEMMYDRVPEYFSALPNLSIDYGILERSTNVYVRECRFGWADFGSWHSLHDDIESDDKGNVVLDTEALLYDCKDNLVCLPKGRVAVIDGLNGYVVAEQGNVLMICPKDDAAALRRMMTDAQVKLGEELA